jgi:hypothetical protein
MKHIQEKMEADKATSFRKDDQGVLWFKDRIVVLRMLNSINKSWMKPILVGILFILEVLRCTKI